MLLFFHKKSVYMFLLTRFLFTLTYKFLRLPADHLNEKRAFYYFSNSGKVAGRF